MYRLGGRVGQSVTVARSGYTARPDASGGRFAPGFAFRARAALVGGRVSGPPPPYLASAAVKSFFVRVEIPTFAS